MHVGVERVALPDSSFVAATFFTPPNPRASIVISAAMGVTQKFYLNYAQWLATQGYAVTIYDYRGMGLSAPASLRNYKMSISDWAQHDVAAVIAATKSRAPQLPLFVLGHSLGAQIIGMIPNRHLIDGMIVVASGSGYWRETSPPPKRNSRLMWYLLAPTMTPLFGYFPGKKLRVIADLPRGVVEQWRRWCLHPEYLLGAETSELRDVYASIRMPILCMSFTDDEMMSATSTEALLRYYANADIQRMRFTPKEIDERRIGHFGFFRPQLESKLWPKTTHWLEQRCKPANSNAN
jgi:predicted alpha/beta hydrolase